MTIRPLSFLALAGALTLSACGGGDTAEPATATGTAPAATASVPDAVVPEFDGPPAEITITPVGEQMEYEQKEFTVQPGQTVRLTFQNTATMEAMQHNVVILQQNASVNEVGQAAMSASDNEYIPADLSDQIVAYTPLAAPGETVTVEFTAPAEGDYTYICTFPGHYMVMQGTMRVAEA